MRNMLPCSIKMILKLDLNSWVSVDNNSGTTYKNAKLKLVAGDVNRVQDNRRDYTRERSQ